MDLEALYFRVKEAISGLDPERIWPGFAPLKFALYDDAKCFFDGRWVEKTQAFCANTSIVYEGEQIAIWMVQEELEIPVLTSKIVHEMFHGFQTQAGWDCWPDEMEALYRYEYKPENLGLKLRENELLLALLGGFDEAAFGELISLRKLRSEKYPYEFSCESKFEEIEGSANYVEWQVLKQLDADKAAELEARMRTVMTKPEQLFPIRISCYFTGALMINALLGAGRYSFEPAKRPAIGEVLSDARAFSGDFPGKAELLGAAEKAAAAYFEETDAIIRAAEEKNEVVLKGPAELAFVNIYNARRRGGFITSTYFLMYREGGEDRMLPGNFVIRMRDGKTIDAVYKWE